MQKLRKIASIFLVFALVFGMVPTITGGTEVVKAEELPEELPDTIGPGNCGENITWTLTKDTDAEWDIVQGKPYRLTLTGTGDMPEYISSENIPWYTYREMITSISIGKGITSVSEFAFEGCASLKAIEFPNSLENIGRMAFLLCHLWKQ